MSRFLTKNGSYIEEIESMDRCRYKIDEICCNDVCYNIADYCEVQKKDDCKYYIEEDGILSKEE